MNINIPDSLDTNVYIIGFIAAIILISFTTWLSYKKIASIELSNKDVLEHLLETSPTINQLQDDSNSNAKELETIKDDLTSMRELANKTYALTLQQCIYSRIYSKEKHEYIIESCKKYIEIMGIDKSAGVIAHLHNLERELTWRDASNCWDYSITYPYNNE